MDTKMPAGGAGVRPDRTLDKTLPLGSREPGPFSAVYGMLDLPGSTDEWIEEIRGKAELPPTRPAMKAVVSEKGQVTIPKRLRSRLGISVGQVLEFSEEHGKLVAVKAAAKNQDDIDRVYGMFKHLGKRTDDVMRELRGEPDAV